MSEAGWFPDPESSDLLRWWDGEAWSSHTSPVGSDEPVRKPSFPSLKGKDTGSAPSFPKSLPPRLSETQKPATPTSLPTIRKLPVPPQRFSGKPLPPRLGAERDSLPAKLPPRLGVAAAPEVTAPKPSHTSNPYSARDAGLSYGFEPAREEPEERHSSTRPPEGFTVASEPETVSEPAHVAPEPRRQPVKQKKQERVVKKFWTSATVLISSAAVALTLLVPTGLNMYRESLYERADEVADGFIASVVAGDEGWVDFATPETFDPFYVPIYGSAEAGSLSGLEIEISRGDVFYNNPCDDMEYMMNLNPVGCADKASTRTLVTYQVGNDYRVVSEQLIHLSRPYYYEGDDTPKQADRYGKLTSIGEWSVSDIQVTQIEEGSQLYATSDSESGEAVVPDYQICESVKNIFVHMSQSSRINDMIADDCAVDKELRGNGESLDIDELVESFPIYNEATALAFPNKVGVSGLQNAPYSQYELETESGVYVFSFILADSLEAGTEYRMLSITKKAETENGGDDEDGEN